MEIERIDEKTDVLEKKNLYVLLKIKKKNQYQCNTNHLAPPLPSLNSIAKIMIFQNSDDFNRGEIKTDKVVIKVPTENKV